MPNNIETAIPTNTMPTTAKGETCTNLRKLIRSGASKLGAVPAVTKMGTTAIETIIDANKNNPELSGWPSEIINWPAVIPPRLVIM